SLRDGGLLDAAGGDRWWVWVWSLWRPCRDGCGESRTDRADDAPRAVDRLLRSRFRRTVADDAREDDRHRTVRPAEMGADRGLTDRVRGREAGVRLAVAERYAAVRSARRRR